MAFNGKSRGKAEENILYMAGETATTCHANGVWQANMSPSDFQILTWAVSRLLSVPYGPKHTVVCGNGIIVLRSLSSLCKYECSSGKI